MVVQHRTQDTDYVFFSFSYCRLLIPRSATWNAWSLLVTAPIVFGNASHDIALHTHPAYGYFVVVFSSPAR